MANEKKGLVDITTGAEVSDANANGILDLTSAEVTQVAAIGSVTISSAQWGYLGDLDQALTQASAVNFAGVDVDSGTFQLATGTTVNEIVTSVSGSSTDNQIATAKGVWDAIGTADSWDEVMHNGNTFTVLDTENISASITQNDTTNNPAALIIANTGTGNDITLPNSSYIKNGTLVLGADVGLTGTRVTKGWFTDVESTNMYTVGGTSLADTFQARAPASVPASDSATGTQGDWSYGSGYFYVCVATDTWIRTAVVTSFGA